MNRSLVPLALILLVTLLATPRVGKAEERSSETLFSKALLALPASLQSGASVVAFDAEWNRRVIHLGTNKIACVSEAPFMGAQYAVCQHESAEAFWVMGMKLRAEGQTANEVDKARIEAMRQGSLEIPQTGTASYWWQTGESIASNGDFTSQCDKCINRASNRAGFI